MPYRTKEERQKARQNEVKRVKENRVIAGFVFHKYPAIYNKAKALHTALDQLYPGKHDLRRTQEYERAVGKETGRYKYLERCTVTTNSPVAQDQPPVAQDQPPVAQDQPPVAQDQPPVAQDQPPVAQDQPPVAQDQPPVAQDQPPVAQDQPPVAQDQPPVAQDHSPVAQDQQPVTQGHSPVAQDQAPVAQDQSPVAPHNSPVAQDQAPVVPENLHGTIPLIQDEIIDNIVSQLMEEPDIATFFNNIETDTVFDQFEVEINNELTPLEKELM